jgi:hypothetical protein
MTPASSEIFQVTRRVAAAFDTAGVRYFLGGSVASAVLGSVATSAKSSPRDQVLLFILLDNSTSPQAKVYLQYCRVPKRR